MTSRLVNNAYVYWWVDVVIPLLSGGVQREQEYSPVGWFFPRVPSVNSVILELHDKAKHRRFLFKRTK